MPDGSACTSAKSVFPANCALSPNWKEESRNHRGKKNIRSACERKKRAESFSTNSGRRHRTAYSGIYSSPNSLIRFSVVIGPTISRVIPFISASFFCGFNNVCRFATLAAVVLRRQKRTISFYQYLRIRNGKSDIPQLFVFQVSENPGGGNVKTFLPAIVGLSKISTVTVQDDSFVAFFVNHASTSSQASRTWMIAGTSSSFASLNCARKALLHDRRL